MTFERLALLTCLTACLSACSLSPPPAPSGIDCDSDRAAERFPDACGDGGQDSGSGDE
jgi:hypothetical protein